MFVEEFFNFIDMVDAHNPAPKGVLHNLMLGSLKFEDWEEQFSKLRRDFEKSVFVNCVDNPDFKEKLVVYALKFQNIINELVELESLSDEDMNKENKKLFYSFKCRKLKLEQITLAYNHIKNNMCDLTELSRVYFASRINEEAGAHGASPKNVWQENKFETNYTEEQICKMFEGLVEEGYISLDTCKNDFIYYFSGKGEIPINKIKWLKGKGKLALFIDYFFGEEKRKWIKTANIFYNVSSVKLRNSLNTEKTYDRGDYFKDFEKKWIK